MRTSAAVLAIFYLAVGIAPSFATQLGSMDKVLAKREDTVESIKKAMIQQYRTMQSHLQTHSDEMHRVHERMGLVHDKNADKETERVMKDLHNELSSLKDRHDIYNSQIENLTLPYYKRRSHKGYIGY
ncbi:hypothetical protein F5148DRAFT_1149948 [Russula earlei]|uniref:Uncharacterized protein n=1 Tax=Russula earlei TaxID=71964 RepID=A0ACC0U8J1_9AGAM|nr:hypothetical protein F5148DRAFT_1149948 [Russula earlei]